MPSQARKSSVAGSTELVPVSCVDSDRTQDGLSLLIKGLELLKGVSALTSQQIDQLQPYHEALAHLLSYSKQPVTYESQITRL